MSILFKIVFLLSLLILYSKKATATNFYVNNASLSGDVYCTATGNNSNNGTSPSTPKATLSNILSTYAATLTSGDRIYIDAGTYSDANLTLNKAGIRITGAGPAKTVFDNANASIDANNFLNIVANNITIDGCLIKRYNRSSAGSAIQITSVTGISLNNVLTDDNKAGGGSSTIVITGPNASVTFNGGGSNCNSTLSIAGGGVNIEGNGNNVTFNNYSFSKNNKDVQSGSGLYAVGSSTVTIINSIFADNKNSNAYGGAAIYADGGVTLNVSGSKFVNNVTTRSDIAYGGAVVLGRYVSATFNNCIFSQNKASGSGKGGAIYTSTSFGSGSTIACVLNIQTCSFSGNLATLGGSGNDIYNRGGTVTVTNTTFVSSTTGIINGSGTFKMTTSGNPTKSGTFDATGNTLAPTSSPVTSYPTLQGSCYGIVLPVEFLDFSGTCQLGSNDLHWSTATEHNNAYFTIERAGIDEAFIQIATIQGSQTTTEITNYDFQDAMPLRGLNYYRLSQTDLNGDSQILKTISVDNYKCLEDENGMYVYADQSGDYITIDYTFQSNKKMNIEIYNSIGQLIETQSLQFEPAVSKTQIHLRSSFSNGMYFLKLSDLSEAYTEKFMIRKQ